jgi:8-oxo-dGTP pyrophosphatase MutT (NUDIX family)
LDKSLNFVVAVIMNQQNQLLLLQRASTARRDPNKWGLAGGRLELGEEPEAAMIRELGEELGPNLNLRLDTRLGPIPAIGLQDGLVHLFRYTMVSGQIALNHEHTEYQWSNQDGLLGFDLMPGVTEDLTYFGIWLGRLNLGT